jgi:hypothetical protein
MTNAITPSFCAEGLRTIGHDLQLRGIKTFLVRCEADLFVVEGGYQSPPAITPVTLHYGPGDVEQLNRNSRERNDHLSAGQDFLSLSKILWAIATYVTDGGSRLLSISNTTSTETMPVVKVEYDTVQGDRVVDDLNGFAIYELCVSAYRRRRAADIKATRYNRFSALH